MRKIAPRRALAQLVTCTRNPVEIRVEQHRHRLADLVPLRFARMLADPFSVYRGAAALMAADLAGGGGSTVSAAIVDWSYLYADKTLADFRALQAAAKAGEIEVAADPLR